MGNVFLTYSTLRSNMQNVKDKIWTEMEFKISVKVAILKYWNICNISIIEHFEKGIYSSLFFYVRVRGWTFMLRFYKIGEKVQPKST